MRLRGRLELCRLPLSSAELGECVDGLRTNYRFERRERDRLKQAKKEEKLRKQQERKAALQDGETPPEADGDAQPEAKTQPEA